MYEFSAQIIFLGSYLAGCAMMLILLRCFGYVIITRNALNIYRAKMKALRIAHSKTARTLARIEQGNSL